MTAPSKDTRRYLAALGRKGARSRARHLTAAQRRRIARKAAKARWAKVRAKKQQGR